MSACNAVERIAQLFASLWVGKVCGILQSVSVLDAYPLFGSWACCGSIKSPYPGTHGRSSIRLVTLPFRFPLVDDSSPCARIGPWSMDSYLCVLTTAPRRRRIYTICIYRSLLYLFDDKYLVCKRSIIYISITSTTITTTNTQYSSVLLYNVTVLSQFCLLCYFCLSQVHQSVLAYSPKAIL